MAALCVGICVWSACAWAHHTCILNHVGKGHSYMRTLFIHSYGSVCPQRWSWQLAEDEIESNWAMIWFLPRSDRECMLPREKMVGNKRTKAISMQVLEKGGKPLIKVMYWTSSSWLKWQHQKYAKKSYLLYLWISIQSFSIYLELWFLVFIAFLFI
jgi:hypothetical protein